MVAHVSANAVPANSSAEEDRYTVHAPASVHDGSSRVLKHDETFAVLDRQANIPKVATSHGLYHRGTRHLSEFGLGINGAPLLLLGSSVSHSNSVLTVDLSNPGLVEGGQVVAHAGELHIQRTCFLWEGARYERLRITNFRSQALSVQLAYSFSADFVDLFEVRGTPREKRGVTQQPRHDEDRVTFIYVGLDQVERRTHVIFDPRPARLGPHSAVFDVHLEPQASREFVTTVVCENDSGEVGEAKVRSLRRPGSFDTAMGALGARAEEFQREACSIRSDNDHLVAWMERSAADLAMMVTRTRHGLYPYAGVPWFSTAFGRDGLIAAYQSCWFHPEIARGVLSFLASYQATHADAERDAEPGKILHELREGEMAALREIPFGRYYGSVDSTPLFVMLARTYFDATHDVDTLAALLPSIRHAINWIERYGDCDGDGFVEYGRRSANGLVQQGWKDSSDSVWHADGSDAPGPIALCEVQGYAYAAYVAGARICGALGHTRDAERLENKAAALRAAFDEAFWCDEIGTYALALDGQKRPCRVRNSNAGHCLWSGIALPHRAAVVAETLLSPTMFSGWGIRTIASCEARYNPMSYHNGSVWPHDNAIIAEGFARYGFKEASARVFEALFDLSKEDDLHRLPELVCGFARDGDRGPVGYPTACAPQAWSAASVFALLRAATGLTLDGAKGSVCFDLPVLPSRVNEVTFDGLRVGNHRATVQLYRAHGDIDVHVLDRGGTAEIAIRK